MKETYEVMHTIRGTRYAIKLEKRVKGIPGFAPEYKDKDVCDVVFNFPHGEEARYIQFTDNPPILEKEDVEQILTVMNREFKEEDWSMCNNSN